MTENEVRGLCLKSREIFLQQPILLELEAPLKICGKKFKFINIPNLFLTERSNLFFFNFIKLYYLLCFRWYTWSIHRFIAFVRIWRFPTRIKLFVLGRLCRSWQAIIGVNMPAFSIQNQISWELFPITWKSRVCQY